MGIVGHRLAGAKRAHRAAGRLRLTGRQRNAVSLFAALVIILGALIPSWHAAQKMAAQDSPPADRQSAHSAGHSTAPHCHGIDGGTSEQKRGDGAPIKQKPCPLCLALQLFSPGVAQPDFIFLPCAQLAVAAFVPHYAKLKAGREPAGLARPRAPPAA